MELTTLKKSIAAFGLGSILVFGAAACGEAEDAANEATDAAANAADDAANAADDAANAAEDAAGDAADAAGDAADDAANAADDAMDSASDMVTLDPASASVEDIQTALDSAGVADAETVATQIKDNAPYADEAALRAAVPDVDDATFETIKGIVQVG